MWWGLTGLQVAATTTAMDFWSVFGKVSLGLGILLVVCFTLFKQVSESIAGWLAKRLRLRYDRQLEEYRAMLSQEDASLRSVLSTMSRDQTAVQERTLNAVSELWDVLLSLREAAKEALFPYEILTSKEISNAFQDTRTHQILEGIPAAYEKSKELLPKIARLEEHRPYLGESLWSTFSAYVAFANRMIVKTHQGIENSKLFPWDEGGLGPLGARGGKDKATLSLLASVLRSDQVDYTRERKIGAPQAALAMLEQKLLFEIEHRVFGRHLSESAVRELESIRKNLLQMRPSEDPLERS